MHKEILTKEQIDILPAIREFSKDFILVGGTAIALHIGHRRSIDFDLFSYNEFDNSKIKKKFRRVCRYQSHKTLIDQPGEYTFIVHNVKVTFLNYPYKINSRARLNHVRIPDLLTLAAMKAYALGRRPKWKDYVDLYFILKDFFSFKQISTQAKRIFGDDFNERVFREAIVYFKDINYSEEVDYLAGHQISDKIIKAKLVDFSLD